MMTPEQMAEMQAREAREASIRQAIPQAEHQRLPGLDRYEQMQIRAAGYLAAEERRWTAPGCHENRLDRYLFWSGIEWTIDFLAAYGFDLSSEALRKVQDHHKLSRAFALPRTFDDCRAILDFPDPRESLDRFGNPPAGGPDA